MLKQVRKIITTSKTKQERLSKEFQDIKSKNQIRAKSIRSEINQKSQFYSNKRKAQQRDFDIIRNK